MTRQIVLLIAAVAGLVMAGEAAVGQQSVAADASTPAAQTALLNMPEVTAWSIYGPGQTHALRRDRDVKGGGAMRVRILSKAAAVQDIGATQAVTGAIAKGDKLILAFWVRQTGKVGTATIPAMIQVGSPPYTPIIYGAVSIDGTWQLVKIVGGASQDHPAGSAVINLHLGGLEGSLDLGPALLMKL